MSNLILLSVVLITLALVLYSVAVWMNWRARRLTVAMAAIFWVAIVCDATATRLMGLRAETIRWDLHTISGYLALLLMIALAAWGSAGLVTRREQWLTRFHRYAVPIWVIWVISYATGVYLGVQRVSGS
jgi:uncharacterized repeat protein (TIGR03987 family)